MDKNAQIDRVTIYHQHRNKCAQLYLQMKIVVGEERVEPIGAPDLSEFRLFTHESVKNGVLNAFT